MACLGVAKITTSPGGYGSLHADHSWMLSGSTPGGMVFADGYCFRASMKYRFVTHEAGYRVTTLEYIYSLSKADSELWAVHWHPVGSSHETRTHLHAHLPGATSARSHLPIGRFTFEDAVEWVIESGVSPAREDWPEILRKSKELHITHRTWHGDGPAR